MSSPVVGAARIEITGDVGAFAARAETEIKGLFTDLEATITESMASADARFAEGGATAGKAYTTGLGKTVAIGSEAAVTEGAAGAAAAAETEFGVIGKEAGIKFAEKAKETVKGLGGTIFAGVGILGIGELAKGSVEQADKLEAANIQVDGSFGKSADGVKTWATTMASQLGLSEAAAESAAGTFGQMFHAMGVGQPEAAAMSEKMSALVENVAKFNNADPATVQQDFVMAMRGRGKALMQLGINLDTTTIAAEALSHHIVKTSVDQAKLTTAQDAYSKATAAMQVVDKNSASTALQRKLAADAVAKAELGLKAVMVGKMPVLTQSQKGEASYYATLDATKNQENAVADSSHTLAQQKKILGAEVSNLEAKIGAGLMPILTSLSEDITRDVLPAIEEFGHWIVQNKAWIEPLAQVLGALAAAFVVAKLAVGGYNAVMKVGKDIHGAYSAIAKSTGKALDTLGLSNKAAADAQANVNVTASEGAGAVEREGAAAAVAAPEMDALAASTQAAADAQAELDVAQKGGGGGAAAGLGGKAAKGGGEAATGLEGVAADAPAAEAALAGVGAEAATAEGAVAGIGAAGEGAAIGLAPIGVAIGGFVVGGMALSKVIDSWDGGAKMMATVQAFGTIAKDDAKSVTSLSDAFQRDGEVVGTATATYVAAQLQQQGLADKAAAAGVSLGALTVGVTGNNAEYTNLIGTLNASGKVSSATIIETDKMRQAFLKSQTQAAASTKQQQALNTAVSLFKSPKAALVQIYDLSSAKIKTIGKELDELDGRTVSAYVEISTAFGATTVGRQGGPHNVSAYADGGSVADGYFTAGEQGVELGYKSGNHVEFLNHAASMRSMATGSASPAAASTGGLTGADRDLLVALANRQVVLTADKRMLALVTAEGDKGNARR